MNKSLEEPEGIWRAPETESSLVLRCHAAHEKPIDKLTELELATFLEQKIGLKWILPQAMKQLAETDQTVRNFSMDNSKKQPQKQ